MGHSLNNDSETFFRLKYSEWPTLEQLSELSNSEFERFALVEWAMLLVSCCFNEDIIKVLNFVQYYTDHTNLADEVFELINDLLKIKNKDDINIYCEHELLKELAKLVSIAHEAEYGYS